VSTYDPTILPDALPEPVDDGGADHLPGVAVPPIELPATDGRTVRLDRSEQGSQAVARTVVYAYPRTGRPDEEPLVPDWDEIPGARGCTPESCAFRDHHTELLAAGAEVYGLSTQDTDYQREASERLNLPFPLLSDADLLLTNALRLPTFQAAGQTLIKRVTLVVRDGRIEHVFYPIFPPDGHAQQVLNWLRANPAE
jgi:peroxiredoxin